MTRQGHRWAALLFTGADIKSARPAFGVGAGWEDAAMAIKVEARKRLWGRSGNRCAKCRVELVRPDEGGFPGALVGEEAHIIARSPGGARYEPLDPDVRDGYDNLILLCANDHSEVDTQATRYRKKSLRTMKARHEQWVKDRLHAPTPDDGATFATIMRSGDDLWPLINRAFGWYLGTPEGLTEDEEDLIDSVLQTITDWCDISTDVELQGLRSVREAKRSMTVELDSLASAGLVLLGGQRKVGWENDDVAGLAVVLEVMRPAELESLRVAAPGQGVSVPKTRGVS